VERSTEIYHNRESKVSSSGAVLRNAPHSAMFEANRPRVLILGKRRNQPRRLMILKVLSDYRQRMTH